MAKRNKIDLKPVKKSFQRIEALLSRHDGIKVKSLGLCDNNFPMIGIESISGEGEVYRFVGSYCSQTDQMKFIAPCGREIYNTLAGRQINNDAVGGLVGSIRSYLPLKKEFTENVIN